MSGKTVLILEDEAIIGLDLADSLHRAGYRPSGPFTRSDEAMDAIARNTPDLAVLDIDLGGGRTSSEVAEILSRLGVPFLFLTGQSVKTTGVLHRFKGVPAVDKPCMPEVLLREVDALLRLAA